MTSHRAGHDGAGVRATLFAGWYASIVIASSAATRQSLRQTHANVEIASSLCSSHVWTAPLMQEKNAVDGWSIAILCPACWRGCMSAGPDGFRDPAPNNDAASKAVASAGFSGSSVRPIVISLRSFTPAPARRDRAPWWPVPNGPSRHAILARTGVQSRPKPRGGSIACDSLRSSSQIARNASAVALSSRLTGRLASHAAYLS
jgi:hypothetical protein